MIDVMLSKATTGMLIAELLNRRNEKEVPLFMGKSILFPSHDPNPWWFATLYTIHSSS